MKEQEVKDQLFEDFKRWMRGQTIGTNDDGSFNYYDSDVNRYRHLVQRMVLREVDGDPQVRLGYPLFKFKEDEEANKRIDALMDRVTTKLKEKK